MRGELRRMQRELGITFVHVTHTQPEAIALADLVVVMDQGHIEQAASAHTVYTEPYSAYVARFMGGQNVLVGRVSDSSEGTVVLDLANGGTAEFSTGTAPAKGSTMHIAVRRDRIHLAEPVGKNGKGAVNTIGGKVRSTEYQGSWVKLTLDGGGPEDFVVNLPESEFFAKPAKTGDIVHARWAAKDVHVLAGGAGRSDRPYAQGQN
jgi:putative spermidine/putrescine transport system ATP-binding protein